MGDMCEKINVLSSSSPAASDEMSLLLQQILVRSSSSSLPSSLTGLFGSGASSPAVGGEIFDSSNANRVIGRNNFLSSSSVGPSENDNDNDEYDCESEEGLEALAEEMPEKSAIRRGSSKRSRAAEVHNLSEKRRRSKINEKMKALQNLIPNSNKTDKASMLDEAIEYLKQLQLQVQMLAMRNGLSLYPVSLLGGLHPTHLTQMRMDENRSLQLNPPGANPLHQQTTSTQNQQFASNILNTVNSETTTPMQPHLAAFQLQSSAQDVCKEKNNLEASHLEFGVEAMATLAPFSRQSCDINGDSLETCVQGDWSENLLLKAIEQSLIKSSNSNSVRTGRSAASSDAIKIEKANR